MNHRLPLFAFSVLAALTVACGGHRSVPAREPEPAPVRARAARAERVSAARRIELAGTVEAERSASVSSRVMAGVTAVHVRLGDEVRAGQALISIDPSASEGQVAQARGALAQAESALALARRNHERYQALAASRSASELELDLARSQFEQAQGAVQQARGAVASASSVARDSAVVAPFAGRITARLVEVGDLAAPGRPLVTIESRAGRRLVVAVSETIARAAALAPGAPLAVSLDAQTDLGEIEGRIAEISPGPDGMTHAYTIKIDLPAGRLGEIAAGAAGRAYLSIRSEGGDAVRVPQEALIESGGLTLVVVRNREGKAESRVVTAGARGADSQVEILSGLAGGESVVLGLAHAPTAGTRIEVRP